MPSVVRFGFGFGLVFLALLSLHGGAAAFATAPSGAVAMPVSSVSVPDGSGGMLIACTTWRGARFAELYVQRVNAAGATLWTTAGSPLSCSTGDKNIPAVVSDGNGGALVAWVDRRNGPAALYVQRVNALGVAQWTAGGVWISSTVDGNDPISVQIASDVIGEAIVAWRDTHTWGDIYAQRVSGNGVPLWGSGGVAVGSTAETQNQPAMIADGAGGAIVAWVDARNDGTPGSGVYAQRLSSVGSALWVANGVLVCGTVSDARRPSLALSATGSPIVTWLDPRGVHAQRLSSAGATQWIADGVALCTASGNKSEPSIASDGGGGAVIAWWDERSSTPGLYVARVTGAGVVPWTADGVPLRTGVNFSISSPPAIAPDGVGGTILAWKEWLDGPGRAMTQRVSGAGLPQWGDGVELPLNAFYGDQDRVSIVADGAGGAIVGWREWGVNEPQVFAQRVSGTGALPWGGSVGLYLDAGVERAPAVVPDGVGGTITVWMELAAGQTDLFAKRVDAAGIPVFGRVAVCTAPGDQCYPAAASDGAGGVFVTWSDTRDGADIFVAAQHLNGSGIRTWPADGVAVSTVPNWSYNSGIVADGLGGAVIAWQGFGTSGRSRVYAQRLNATGIAQWAAGGVALCTATGEQIFTNEGEPTPNGFIVSDGAGGAIVAWKDERGGAGTDIYAQRVSAAGAPLWSPTGLALCTASGEQTEPRVTSDGSGGMIAVWSDGRMGGYFLAAQRVDASGTCRWAADGVAVMPAPTGHVFRPVIAGDGIGGAIVSWAEDTGILAQRLDANVGGPLWATSGVPVCAASQEQDRPRLAPDGAGGAIVVWTDYRASRSNDAADIYAQRLNATGLLQWTASGSVVCGQSHSQLSGSVVSDGAGGFVLTWIDRRDGAVDHLVAQRLNASGALLWPAGGVSDVPAGTTTPTRFALLGARPNPAVGAPTIAFSLPDGQPASLEILDVTGRRVAYRALAGSGAGDHLMRLPAGSSLAPGVYIARLIRAERSITRKVCVVSR